MRASNIFYIIILLYLLSFVPTVYGIDSPLVQWEPYEITLTAYFSYANPYLDVEITAHFSGPGGVLKRVKGFWDGGNTYKIRFTPTVAGPWIYTISSNPTDPSLISYGNFVVDPPGSNRGFIRVDTDYPSRFVYDNGDYYLMLGTTAYEYIANAADDMDRWKNSVDHYAAHGINKVRFFVFPTDYRYYCKEGPRNDAETYGMKYPDSRPFTGTITAIDYDQLNLQHWQVLDEMVAYMASKDVIAELIMLNDPCYAKSFVTADPAIISEKDRRYMKYIVSRYAAYTNVIWTIVNEYYLEAAPPFGLNKPAESDWRHFWNAMGTLAKEEDPWILDGGKKRPLSIHGKNFIWVEDETNRPLPTSYPIPYYWFEFDEQEWPSYAIAQWGEHFISPPGCYKDRFSCGYYIPDGISDWEGQRAVIQAVKNQGMPVVNDEFKYVGMDMNNSLSDSRNSRMTMWATYLAGAYYSIGDWYADPGEVNQGWGKKHMSSGDYTDTGEMKKVFDEMKILSDFFSDRGIEYWKMSSHNELVPDYDNFNRVYMLANPGKDYIVYDAEGKTFDLNLESGKTYDVMRINPESGAETDVCSLYGGIRQISSLPGQDSVYYISDSQKTCVLSSASWSSSAATEGEVIELIVEGSDCDGQVLSVEVIEDDLFGGNDFTVSQPQDITFDGTVAKTSWTAEYYLDGTEGNPEYYFQAVLVSDPGVNINSPGESLLAVAEDNDAPSIPLNLQALTRSSVHVELSWEASIDNVETAGYEIFRDGELVTLTDSTVYNDSGLVPSTTYTYLVKAYDIKQNRSGESDFASAVTLSLPDATEVAYYCDYDSDTIIASQVSGLCTGGGCEPQGCLAWPGTDCDDNDDSINPASAENWYDGTDRNCDGKNDYDRDMDGYVDSLWNVQAGGTAPGMDDCDDGEAAVNPGMPDVPYDGVDQDCSGSDNADLDGDGYDSTVVCAVDCDDGDPAVNPQAEEVWYDGTDRNCDGENDYDQDRDGYVSDAWNIMAGGTAPGINDCDDTDPAIRPGVAEVWYDGVDQDCDGKNDYDMDADGYVDSAWNIMKGGSAPEEGDCDDTNELTHPAVLEVCDSVDNNCDGSIDEGFDGDGDSYTICAGDCDDTDPGINPGADEVPYDGIDQNCDGEDLVDVDGDGHPSTVVGASDCDDNLASVHPEAEEIWYDGTDQNCDGNNDYDQDFDGYVKSSWNSEAGGTSPETDDCDDLNATVYDGAGEIPYDGIDQDCSGTDLTDVDGDGHGAAGVKINPQQETCTVENSGADMWYVGVHGFIAGDYTVTARLISTVPESPVVLSSPVTKAVVGHIYTYDVRASGYPEPSYGLVTSPNGMTIDADTGMIQWVCPAEGEYEVSVEAGNGVLPDSTQNYTILCLYSMPLLSHEPQSGSVSEGSWNNYLIISSEEHSEIEVTLTDLTCDVDLYVRAGLNPTTTSYHCRPYLSGTAPEVCLLPNSVVTRWYIGVNGFSSCDYTVTARLLSTVQSAPVILSVPKTETVLGEVYEYEIWASGYPDPVISLLESPAGMTVNTETGRLEWVCPAVGDYDISIEAHNGIAPDSVQDYTIRCRDATTLESEVPYAGSVQEGRWDYYLIEASDNDTSIEVELSDYIHDLDLYVRKGAKPMLNDYDCRPFETGTDCDDTDAEIHSGMPELCDSLDNNCDGSIDEGFDGDSDTFTTCAGDCDDANPVVNPETFWYPDNDGDGYGNPAIYIQQCEQLAGFELDNSDCSDSDPFIYPDGPPVRIRDQLLYFEKIQDAYNLSGDGDVLQSLDTIFTEDISFEMNKSVILEAGHDCSYTTPDGMSLIEGDMIIHNGRLSIERGTLVIQ